ncbi:hypothetical protein FQN57_000464 [Myotisia sp. PD_48]|nr:hypothetical protein FQN57_000464 [Myotisia sp. PD_48]
MVFATNNIAFTAPINPPGATPVLKHDQVWAGLLLKIRSAETFVSSAIESTSVISESIDPSTQNLVTVREVIFREGNRKVQETVTAYEDCRVDFIQPNGSLVSNVISEGEGGELYMTYVFEWRHPDVSKEEHLTLRQKEKDMSELAVKGTIDAMRTLAKNGKL